MKAKRFLAGAVSALLALSLCACSAGTETPPFTDLSMNCSESDVIKEYGEDADAETNSVGGKIYKYDCTYLEKNGTVSFSFGEDGKLYGIFWNYFADSEDELNELSSTITDNMTEKYGEQTFQNGVENVWKGKNTSISMIAMSVEDIHELMLGYLNGDQAEEISESADNTSQESVVSAGTIYHEGDVAAGNGFALTVDSVDATPEYLNYNPADSGYEFFFASFELENTGSDSLDMGSFFTVTADGEECRLTSFSDPYNGVDWLDQYSDLESGRKVQNYISAVVPEKWNEIQIICPDGSAFSFAHTDLGSISSQEDVSEETVYHMGDTMTRTGMKITLESGFLSDYIQASSYSHYEPDEGNYFLVLFFDIRNDSTQTQQFKIYSVFDVYVDDYADNMTSFMYDIDGKDSLSDQDYTDILSGKSISGYTVVEVPTDWQKVELVSRQGTFEITPDVVSVR